MIEIKTDRGWKVIESIFAGKDIVDRYRWFLFEFGKKSTRLFIRNLKDRLTRIPGSRDYKKRLVLAEVRDKSQRSWWAVVVSSKRTTDAEFDPKKSIFHVVTRFPGMEDDPVAEILEALGPWTVDTIPFVPSTRTAAVIQKTVPGKECERIKDLNFKHADITTRRMVKHGISFDPRHVVYQKLRVIRDYEVEALGHEFGTIDRARPHWRPSLRWLRKDGLKKLEKDKDLFRVWTDPRFAKYRQRRHVGVKLTQAELKMIQRFQNKVRI